MKSTLAVLAVAAATIARGANVYEALTTENGLADLKQLVDAASASVKTQLTANGNQTVFAPEDPLSADDFPAFLNFALNKPSSPVTDVLL